MMLFAATLGLALLQQESEFTIDAGRLHVGDGQVIENAQVTIRDGKIVAVSGGGGEAEEGDVTVLTPGLVDAFSFMGVGQQTLEQSRETTSSHRVAVFNLQVNGDSKTTSIPDPAFFSAVEVVEKDQILLYAFLSGRV